MNEILDEKFVTNAEVKEILKERAKETDLGYEQKNTLEYLKKYEKLTLKKAQDLSESLQKVKKLREMQIIAIINLLPKDNDDLRLVLEKDYNNLTDEERNLILENVKKFI